MRPEIVGELVEIAIPFFGGLYATLLGARVIGKKPGVSPKYDEWHDRNGGRLKVVGPLLMVVGAVLGLSGIASVTDKQNVRHPANWQRYQTSDHVCSAEFPQPPKEDVKVNFGIESSGLRLYLEDRDTYYNLTYSDIPPDAPPATDEERLDNIRELMPALGAQMGKKFEFVSEQRISKQGVVGRELEFAAGDKYSLRTKVFILNKRIYRQIAVTPRNQTGDQDTLRFFESFMFEKAMR
jgi:hypothetical protein